MKKTWCSILAVLALALCITSTSLAQETTGSIVGTVKDSAGAAVPGATVSVADPTKGNAVLRTATTSDDGGFSIPNVLVSTYTITVESPNFKKSISTGVKVDVGQRRSVDVTLEAGNIREVVTVQAADLALEASTPTVASTVTRDQVNELSINNRNWVQLITLSPGVTNNLADLVPVGNFSPDGSPNIMAISVNGARQSQNTFTVDGADITDRGANITIQASPSLDSIGEFTVLRALYPAESGRSGGGQINVVTKSGTDKFHGSLFEFVRNEKFNANSFTSNRSAPLGLDANGKAKRSPFRYNNYGFTIGGPVWFANMGKDAPDMPFFAKAPKTYFFFSEEQRKDRRYLNVGPSNVPTAGMRNGVFTTPICLQATKATSTGNGTCLKVLPAGTPLSSVAAYDPASAAYLQYIYSKLPLPDSGGTALSAFPDAAKFDFRQEIIKIDTSITKNWTAYYRYEQDKVPTYSPNGVNSPTCAVPTLCPQTTNAPGKTHTLQSTYAVSPNLIIEGRYTHAYGGIFASTEGLFAAKNSPIPINSPYPRNDARVPFHTGFTTLSNLQGFGDWNNFSQKNDYSASVTWIPTGKHTMKFGGDVSFYHKVEDQLGGNVSGTYSSFANTISSSPFRATVCTDATGTAIACATGLPTTEQQFANFLLGQNVVYTQNKYNLQADFNQNNYEWYAQDEFRATKNVTIYAGVRYSYYGPPSDKNGLLNNFVPELYNAATAPAITYNGSASTRVIAANTNVCTGFIVTAQLTSSLPNCTPSQSPYGKHLYQSPKNNYAPRVGLAWDISGNGTTILRTGYGIYYDQVLLGNVELQLGNPIFQETVTFTGGTLSNPTPPGQTTAQALATGVPTNIRGVPLNYQNPYMQQWSLDVQHLFGRKTYLSVGYYGSKGTHLIGVVDINNLPAGYALTQNCVTSGVTGPCQAKDASGTPIPFGTTGNPSELILDQIRPYKGYRAISMVEPIFNSNYHSLQTQATHRFSGASQIQVAYTWSKNLTDNQTDRSSAPMDTFRIDREYGRAQLDRRHVFTLNYIYELPFYKRQQGFAGKALGGWEVSGITTYQSGLPFTLTVGSGIYDPAGLGLFGSTPATARPNLLCDPNANAPHTFETWFNISCVQTTFPSPAAAVPGNSSRGAINGPSLFKSDVTLSKNFRWHESYRLQLRLEAYNVFNHTNFTTMSLVSSTARTVSATGLVSGFGVITGVRDPRTLQFAAKFYF